MEKDLVIQRNKFQGNHVENQSDISLCKEMCPEHRVKSISSIQLKGCVSDSIFKYEECVENLDKADYLSIVDIVLKGDDHVFEKYPIISKDLRKEIQSILRPKEERENRVQQLSIIFKNLKSQIIASFDCMEKELLTQASQTYSFYDELKNEYNLIIQKKKLKEIILEDSTIKEKSENAAKIIQQVIENSKKIQNLLGIKVSNFNKSKVCYEEKDVIRFYKFCLNNLIPTNQMLMSTRAPSELTQDEQSFF